ncbi:Glycosyl phosphatidyl inositol protein transamidase complex subunit [Rhodosporidiobolus nylandii]
MSRLLSLLRRRTSVPSSSSDPADAFRPTLVRRQKLISRALSFAPYLRTLLVLVGVLYTLALPYKGLGRTHYISENALQPGHVNTYWNWADVHVADLYAESVARWSGEGVSVEQRTRQIEDALQELGLATSRQRYSFALSPNSTLSGINTYAVLPAPKTDGAEAIVLSASWLSRAVGVEGERRINVRGVAIVLALANYFKKYSMWSKDIVLVISDGYSDGVQAWLDAYHGYGQSNLQAEPLKLTTGPIWAALNLDYPHHSFSHVGIYYGESGITPLLHSYDPSAPALPLWLSFLPFASHPEVQHYAHAARNLFRQVAVSADGRVRGPEGTFGRYRIDAISLFGVVADGPHGFHSLGRATESLFRSLNNLLERFHQSFFLYLMTSVDSFIAVGNYLAAPILTGAGLTVQGLMTWAEVGRQRPVGKAVAVVLLAMVAGAAELVAFAGVDPTRGVPVYLAPALLFLHLLLPLLLRALFSTPSAAPLALTLRSIALLLAGLLISITATLNVGLSVFLSLYLAFTLLLPFTGRRLLRRRAALRRAQQLALAAFSPTGLWALWRAVDQPRAEGWLVGLLKSWKVHGGWSLPVALVLAGPVLVVQAVAVVL